MEKSKEKIKSLGKLAILPIILIIVVIVIFIFNNSQKSDPSIMDTSDGKYLAASGTVESNTILISAEIPGTIGELVVKEGDKIKKGDIIVVIKNTELENQIELMEDNIKLIERTIISLEDGLANYDNQNADKINQAKSGYLATQSELQKIKEGASNEEIKAQESIVNQSETNRDYIEKELERRKELLEAGAISESTYDEFKSKYDTALSQYNRAVAQLNELKGGPSAATISTAENKMMQAKAGYELAMSSGKTQKDELIGKLDITRLELEGAQIKLSQAKTELEKTKVLSPIDGRVNLISIDLGEFTSIGKSIAEIYDPNDIEIKAYVSQKNIGYVKVGQDVKIFADFDESKAFKGKVTKINDVAEFTPKNIQTKEERVNTVFEVKLKVTDSEGELKSGMPVDTEIKID